MNKRIPGIGAILVVLSLASGCGLKMEQHYQKMRAQLTSHKYDDADRYIESVKENFYSKDNRLLYYMDKGMVLHLAKRYKESNEFLEKAKATAEELWTESISANAAAWLTTDNSIPYQGEDFEKVVIHFVAALNFIELGEYESARVEAKQITEKLELYNSKYTEEDGKNAYRDDAFARWLSGKLAETEPGFEGKNSAWIDYKKALDVYAKDYPRYETSVPQLLVQDAERVLAGLGNDFADELNQVRTQFPAVKAPTLEETKGLGEIVLVHLSGEAPYKIDKFWEAKANDDLIRIAFPEFVAKPHRIVTARMSVAGNTASSDVGENLTAIAIQNLNDHMARIKAKAIARAVAKYIASKGAQAAGEKMGGTGGQALQAAGAIFQLASAVAEEADKRSWITLPSHINMARIFAPAGDATVDVEFLDANGNVLEKTQLTAKVKAGQPTFVTYRTYK